MLLFSQMKLLPEYENFAGVCEIQNWGPQFGVFSVPVPPSPEYTGFGGGRGSSLPAVENQSPKPGKDSLTPLPSLGQIVFNNPAKTELPQP